MEYLNGVEHLLIENLPQGWQAKYKEFLVAGHPLSKDLPLMNPFHVALIVTGYILSVVVGKSIMKNRKPLSLKAFSLMHNAFLTLLSLYMSVEAARQAYLSNFSLFGNAVVEGDAGIPMVRVLWIFYFSKIFEFIDTWIMIMKKNDRQITFLHLYHHTTIFVVWYIVTKFAPGGDSYFSATQNSAVHVVMYSYYFMSTLAIQVPYKKYITQIQMFQFAVNLLQAIYLHFFPSKYPLFLAQILFVYMISLLILFMNYYFKEQARLRELRKQQTKKIS